MLRPRGQPAPHGPKPRSARDEADPAGGLQHRPAHVSEHGDPLHARGLLDVSTVSRSRRRLRSITSPSWTTTIGSPSRIGRRRAKRYARYETATESSAR